MANTYTSLHYHFIFSTKNRENSVPQELEERIWSYLARIVNANKMHPIQIGGIEDHVHCLLGAPATIAPAKIAQLIKGGSSAWIQETFPELKGFKWQDGYGAFTVSISNIPDVAEYIANQREHHRTKTYQEEYLAFVKRHGIEYDERYVWD
jgi:REP element-mobilizing transposase RayT